MADYQIDCINKPDRLSPHEHITHVGGPNPDGTGRWKDTVPNVVQFIENKQHRSDEGVSHAVATHERSRREKDIRHPRDHVDRLGTLG